MYAPATPHPLYVLRQRELVAVLNNLMPHGVRSRATWRDGKDSLISRIQMLLHGLPAGLALGQHTTASLVNKLLDHHVSHVEIVGLVKARWPGSKLSVQRVARIAHAMGKGT